MAILEYSSNYKMWFGNSDYDVPTSLQKGDLAYFFDTDKNVRWNGTAFVDYVVNTDTTLYTGDLEIGAVEIKNSTDDTRATVGANGLYVDVQNIKAGSNKIGSINIRNNADDANIDPLAEGTFTARLGEVQATPTSNTVLGRLKDLLTGIVLSAGSAIIGKVGIDQTTDGTTNLVVAKQSTHDNLNLNANIQVGNADVSSTNKVNVTSNSSAISASHTRPNNTTAYAIGDVVGTDAATNLTFTNVNTNSGATVMITGAALEIDVSSVPAGMGAFRLHIYNAEPTAITDNLAYNLPSGDRSKYCGWIDIDKPVDLGDTLYIRMNNVNLECTPTARTLYGMLETREVYTPTAQAVKSLTLYCLEV